jgi:hypothetical protein
VSALLALVAIPVGWEAGIAHMASRGYGVPEAEPPGVGLWGFAVFALIVLPPVISAA